MQEELDGVRAELNHHLRNRQIQQEKQQQVLAALRGELLAKTRELEELRLQAMTPQRLELLRAQVQQEIEAPLREKVKKLQEQNQELLGELTRRSGLENGLMKTNKRLRETLDSAWENLKTFQSKAERLVESRHVEWLEEKHKLQEREAELQQRYSELKEMVLINKWLWAKIQLQDGSIEELELQVAATKRQISFLKEQDERRLLKELERIHKRFQQLPPPGC